MDFWKQELLKSPYINQDIADELESHLYDEIETQKKVGLNEKESFEVAKSRLGEIEELQNEFSKL